VSSIRQKCQSKIHVRRAGKKRSYTCGWELPMQWVAGVSLGGDKVEWDEEAGNYVGLDVEKVTVVIVCPRCGTQLEQQAVVEAVH